MKEKNIKIAYDIMLSDGYTNLGTLEEFTKRLDKKGNREVVFNALLQAGVTNMGDFANFEYNILGADRPVDTNIEGFGTAKKEESKFSYVPYDFENEGEGEKVESGIQPMVAKKVAEGEIRAKSTANDATNYMFSSTRKNNGTLGQSPAMNGSSIEQKLKTMRQQVGEMEAYTPALTTLVSEDSTPEERASAAVEMQKQKSQYDSAVENGSSEIFNNIAEGKIGDLEFAYLDNWRRKLLGDLKGILSQMESDYKAMYKSQGGISHSYSPGAGAISMPSSNNPNSEELTTLADGIVWLDEEIKKLESITTKEDWERNGHKGGFLKALGGNLSLFDMFTLGVIDAGANRTVSEILENGPKNKYEKYVADAAKAAGDMEYITQGLGGQAFGSGGGAALGQTLEAMTPFIVGAPYVKGVSATVGLGKRALKAVPYTLGMTAMFPQYTATKYSQSKIDEYKQTGEVLDRTVWDRATDAFGATAIDYFTEMFGGVVTAHLLNKGRKLVPKGWLSAKLQFADNSAAKQLFQSLNLGNAVEELEEELWSTALTPIAQGKSLDDIWNDWEQGFTIENLLTTALTVVSMGAPRVAVMSVTGVAQAEHWRKKANKAFDSINDGKLKQQVSDALKLNSTEDTMKALSKIDWSSVQDIADVQNAWEYIQYKTYAYAAEGAKMSEEAKKNAEAKVALVEGISHRGIVETGEYDGQQVYVRSEDAEGAVVVTRMDGTSEQVAAKDVKNRTYTPLNEAVSAIYQQEAASAEEAAEALAEDQDKADAEAAGVPYKSSAEAQREFDEAEGREAPNVELKAGDIVTVDGKEGEVVSVDAYTKTARVEIDGQTERVPLSKIVGTQAAVEASEQTEAGLPSEEDSSAVEQPTEEGVEAATPMEVAAPKIEATLNEAGEVDVKATGEEQTANYLVQELETPEEAIGYANDKIAEAQKALKKAQSNEKLPLNIAERKKVVAERKAEAARLEEEIAMWEGVKNRLTAPQAEATPTTEQQAEQAVERTKVGYKLSDEVDENGRQFVETSSGSIEFGLVERESGLTPAPILLSEGMITNPQTNDGYGLVHIEARHGDQIREAGYKSVVDFIEAVAKGYTTIREGKKRDGQQTYLLQLTDKHNNTLMVELSSDGTYWNINTAGIFKMSYGKNGKVVYNRYTTAKQTAESVEVSQESEQSGSTETPSISTPASPSENKNTTSVPENQTIEQENVSATTTNPHTREQVEGMAWVAGVVRNNESKRYRFTDVLDKIAKSLGVRIAFVDEVEEGGLLANGLYTSRDGKKTIYIATDRTRGVQFVVGHEILHHLKTISPEAYEQFVKAVMKEMGEEGFAANLNNLRRTYQRAISYAAMRGENPPAMPSDEVLAEEVVADYVGSLISATDGFTKFVKKHKGSKFMQALRSAIQHIRSFFKGANAWERAMDRRLKDLDTLLEDAVGEAKQSNVVKPAQKQTSITTPNNLIDGESGKAMLSLRTYNESGRVDLQKFLSERVKSGDLTQVDATDIITQMDEIYNICKEFTGKYGPFGQWSEASVVKDEDDNPVFSVIKTNGEYAMNLDFSLVCKKRRTLDAVLNEMIARGMIETATDDPVFIAQVNDVIRKYGFETACRLCFVDAKRFRVVRVAQQFADLYNSVVRSMLPKGSKIPINSFDYAQRGVEQSENALNTLPDSELEIDALKKMSEGRSVKAKIAKHLLDNPQDRKLVSVSDFVSTKGFDAVATENPALLGLYNSKKGSGGPKAAFSDVQYLGDVAKANWDVEKAYAVGGVRIQSFSDFVPRMIFDYIQMVGDLAAKNLPAHAYTKEPIFAKIFGKTGIKINLSLVPAVVENGVAAGLDAEGSYAWQEGETFPYEEAIALQNAEGYRENVGTIAVGVSDEHILKMLGDDNIRMVIPYHKSGLNPAVAKANNIDGFKDYTSEQNTRYGNGNKLSKEDAAQAPDFNQLLRELGSAKAAADAYLAWCAENGYKPKFDKFASHPNYYKLLEDFTTTVDGVNVPQEGVRMQFPEDGDAFGSLEELIEQGLEEDAVLEGMRDEKVSQIVDELDGVRFSLREDTESLLSIKEMDAPYLEAVERGDMETAQRMVMEAAKIAMPNTKVVDEDGNPKVVYHGTGSEFYTFRKTSDINELGAGYYFSDSYEMAERYATDETLADNRFRVEELAFEIFTDEMGHSEEDYDDNEFVDDYNKSYDLAVERLFGNGRVISAFLNIEKPNILSRESPDFDPAFQYGFNYHNEGAMAKLYNDGIIDEMFAERHKGLTGNQYVAFSPNQIKSADPVTYDDNGNVIPLSERFNPRKEDVRFSIMGERGAANLDAAEEVTTRLDNLNVAREMESAGKDAKTIKLATGWERGTDGKWRYEIDDLKLVNPEEWVNKKGRLTLKDIVANAEELFAAYPELRDIKIKKSAAVNNNGAYNHAENTITLSVGVLRRGLEIQSNIERFDTARENIDKLMDKVINVEVRGTILHEIQHAIQHIEGFARGGNSKMIDASLDRAKTLAVEQEMINQINEKVRQYNSMPVEERRTPSGVRLRVQIEEGKRRYAKFKKSIQLGDAGYRKLAGEVESRNVEKRLGMTPEERRNTLLAETEDVAREDQIFILYGAEMAEKKKIAEETVSPKDSDHPAAISSATGAKILNNLDNLAKKYQEKTNRPDTFIGDVARALDIEMRNKPSKYGTYLTISGDLITLRLSNHGATVSEFDARNEEEAISIVIDNKYRGGANDGNAHIVEYFYDARKLRKAEGKPLVDIIKSIKQTLYSGQYVDNTGLATRIEINERFSLRLPQYTDAFAVLEEEYNALDKNDAEAVADFRARKREVVEAYWNDFAKALGADVEVMVLNSTNNPEALRPLYDKLKEAAGDDSWFPSFRKFVRRMQKAKPALYNAGTNTIGIDIARADKANTLKDITQLFLHENIHRIVAGSIDRKRLIEIWSEVGKTDFGKRIKKAYKRRPSSVLGNESLAYRIAGTQRTDINPLLDFIEGNNGVSVEDVLAVYENSLPLRDEVVKQILNILRNEYKEKGAGAEAAQEAVKEADVVARKIARDGTSSNRGRGRVGEEAGDLRVDGESRKTYIENGRRITEIDEDLSEVEYLPEFDEQPLYSLKDPLDALREEVITVTGNKLEEQAVRSVYGEQFSKESFGRKFERATGSHLIDVERLIEKLYAAGVERNDDNDVVNALEAAGNISNYRMRKDFDEFIAPMLDVIEKLSLKYNLSYTKISDYLAAKHAIERQDTTGIQTMNEGKGSKWTREICEKIVGDFENKVSGEHQEKLWEAVRKIEQRTLDVLLEAGVYNEADIEAIKSHDWKYYVPLQGWDISEGKLINANEIYELPNRNVSSNNTWSDKKAKGRKTKPYDPIATIVAKLNKAMHVAETNKALQKLYHLVSDTTKAIGQEKTDYIFKVSDALYRKTNDGYVEIEENEMSEEGRKAFQEELKENRKLHTELKKLYADRRKAVKKNDSEKVAELDAKIADVKSQLTIFIKAGDMAIPHEVGGTVELTRARRVYFYVNGRKMFVQFTNPKFSTAIKGEIIHQRMAFGRWISGLTRFLARTFTSNNPAFALITNPIRDFRDAFVYLTMDAEHGNLGGFSNQYMLHWGRCRHAIYRGQRGIANPLTDQELKGKNLLNRDDRSALAKKYGYDRVLDTLYKWYAENGGIIGYSQAYKSPADARKFFGNSRKVKKGDFSSHASVYRALTDSAEIITRFTTFIASLDKGESVGQAVTNARNVSVNFNRRGTWTGRLGAWFAFFGATSQGIYKYVRVARKNPKRFTGICIALMGMGYLESMLTELLYGALTPEDDDDDLINYEIPLWERLTYTVIPVRKSDGKLHTIRIPKSTNLSSFTSIGTLIYEMEKGRITTEEALMAGASQMANSWTYGFSEGASPVRAVVPTALQGLFDLWQNTDAFGREIGRVDKFNKLTPDSELGQRNVIPWIYDLCAAINRATGGNEFRKGVIDINPSKVQYLMEQLAGGYGVMARRAMEFGHSLFDDQVEFELQNIPLYGRLMYSSGATSWYPDYEKYESKYGDNAWTNAIQEFKRGYISEEEYLDIAKHKTVLNLFEKKIQNVIKLRNQYAAGSLEYRNINDYVNRLRGLSVKMQEEINWSSSNLSSEVKRILDKYDPNFEDNYTNIFNDYAKKE